MRGAGDRVLQDRRIIAGTFPSLSKLVRFAHHGGLR